MFPMLKRMFHLSESGDVCYQRRDKTHRADCQSKGTNWWLLQIIHRVTIDPAGTKVNGERFEEEWVQIFSLKLSTQMSGYFHWRIVVIPMLPRIQVCSKT